MMPFIQGQNGSGIARLVEQSTPYDIAGLFCWAVLIFAYLVIFYLLYLRYKERGSDAGTALLQHHIRYHFLFNTLNTTVCLISSHPERASDNLRSLAELFRKMLNQGQKVTLQEEIDTALHYINIEQVRLGDRLKVVWHLDCAAALRASVPGMILQPLIENAIYHGVEKLATDEGCVDVTVEASDRTVTFKVDNPVCSGPQSRGNNQAQANIEKRLCLCYGKGRYQFTRVQSTGKYHVLIKIPKKEEENDKHSNSR